MSDIDERLGRIESRIEIFLERQRLSRFDNFMFLAYPLVILGITLSISPYSQDEALKGIYVWGLPLVGLIQLLRVLLGCVGLAFAFFLIAYAFDSLDFRITSVLVLALTILIPFGSVLVLAALFRIFGGVVGLSTNSSIIALSPFLFSALSLLFDGTFRIANYVGSWFKRIMQTSLKERIVTLSWRAALPAFFPLIARVSWSAGSLMCLMILAIAAWRGQLIGTSVYDVLYVLSFLIATEAIVLYASRIEHALGDAVRMLRGWRMKSQRLERNRRGSESSEETP